MQLRDLSASDRIAIQNWPPYPPEFAELDYALRKDGWLAEFEEKVGTSCFVIEQSGEVIALTILSPTVAGEAEFRIALRADAIGRGLGEGVASLTLEHGFSRLGLSCIQLIVRKNNVRALRLYTRLGFVQQGECLKNWNGKQIRFIQMELHKKGECYETGISGD